MLLTISTTHRPARDLGFLLHKHPDRIHTKQLPFGQAHVFFPEATDERCTATLMLDINPLGLARRSHGSNDFALQPYVNDRPYVASSFLSVALGRMFSTALHGQCQSHPHLTQMPLPFEITIPVLPSRGGTDLLFALFDPLSYHIEFNKYPLDDKYPTWGKSPYVHLKLLTTQTLAQVLTHLYVLFPVLDDEKHYWVSEDEVDKLLNKGAGWLDHHPHKELIVQRYLVYKKYLAQQALEQLTEQDQDIVDPSNDDLQENALEQTLNLHETRLQTVVQLLKQEGCSRVLDLGCGEGKLLQLLYKDPFFQKIVGMDISIRELRRAAKRLNLDRLSPFQRERIEIFQGSLIYKDQRLEGFDGAAVVEVIEHLDAHRLETFSRILFGETCPRVVVLTTPNADYNEKFETLTAGTFRHPDHRFEWTRSEFQTWTEDIAKTYGYEVRVMPIGPKDERLGTPTQMGIFRKHDTASPHVKKTRHP